MEFHDFDALLHLCAVFNLAYTAFQKFSENIKPFFSSAFTTYIENTRIEFSKLVQSVKDAEITTTEEIDTQQIDTKIETKYIEFTELVDNFIGTNLDEENHIDVDAKGYIINCRDWEYGSKFKATYLIAGLYSLLLIFFSSTEKYFDPQKISHAIFVVDLILTYFYIAVFFSTFSKTPNRFSPMSSLIFFLLILVLFSILYHSHSTFAPSSECVIFYSLVIVLFPFFSHFLRIGIEMITIQSFIWNIENKYRKEFREMKNEKEELKGALSVIDKYKNLKDLTEL